MAQSYAGLRQMPLEDPKQQYDQVAGSTQVESSFYRDEMTRQGVEEQGERMLAITEANQRITADVRTWTRMVMWLTIVMTVLTAVNIIF